ncbi:transcriptional coactivator/pterin dehydratase [Halorhabdus utahensis DSM 12940]|uniref:4a-hydroxytetrahydrobiopterin dehydratase n=2 Tax=Halorhabdus utahensis TaxID=146826 RepID=C7NR72_HALUD|nr:transcriptional coactivator/pterin dehydratase [Halorhabdus utahensis DSM 12940]
MTLVREQLADPGAFAPVRTFFPWRDVCPRMTDVLDDDEIDDRLPAGWERDGDEIVRTFEFDAYLDGVGFAAAAGGLAQEAFHHPEMTIGWREVEVRLTTHEADGITDADLELAGRFNDLRE